MKVDLRCSVDLGVYANRSLVVEQLPGESDYSYASAWPRMSEYGQIQVTADLEPNVVGAAASVIKVASWSNGILSKRTWDTDTIPVEVPPPLEWFENPSSLNGFSSMAIYNCASLPHFAIGLPTLHALDSPVQWSYVPADEPSCGIKRLLPTGTDPHEAALSDGHWMIDVGVTGDIMPDSSHALERFGSNERVALHVSGGGGPLLLTQTAAVVEYFDYRFADGILVYDASPVM